MASPSKSRVWELLRPESTDPSGRAIRRVVLLLVLLNVAAVVLQTVRPLYARYAAVFDGFATVSVLLLTAEYVLRAWSSTANPEYRGTAGQRRFVLSPYRVVDVVVIAAFVAGVLWSERLGSFVRLLWVVRFFHLRRFRTSRARFRLVLAETKDDIGIAVTAAVSLVLVSSTAVYVAERGVQPEAFGSIPAALWWAVVTLTTVGYGDVVPVTVAGRVFGALTAVGGIAIFALPSSILAAGFLAVRQEERERTDSASTGE